MSKILLNKRAITKLQTIATVAVIIIIIVAAGVYYYWYYVPSPAEEIKNLDTIKIESYREIANLDPVSLTMASEVLVCWNTFDNLLTLKGNEPGDTTPRAALAESWEVSADAKTWTFKLREDAEFSNGDPINADAVVYNWDRLLVSNIPNSMYLYEGIISKGNVSKVDDYTVQFKLDIPFAAFPSLLTLWHGMMNPAVIEANGGYAADWINTAVATNQPLEGLYSGPYKVVEFTPGTGGHAKLEANENYWGSQPKTKYVYIEWTPETSTRILKLKKGDTDWLWRFPLISVPELLGVEGVEVEVAGTSWDQHFLIFSGLDPLGMDENGKLVRKALCYSFPYDTILQYVYASYAQRSIGAIPQGSPGAYDAITTKYTFNLTKAEELLDQAGYTAHPVTGVRLELEVDYALGAEERKQAIIIWQSELSKIGVQLSIREVAWRTITERMRNGEVDVSASQWYPDYPDPYHFTYSLLHSSSVYGIPGSHWNISQMDQMIEDSLKETNTTKRMELYKPIQELNAENPGRIYIAQTKYVYIHRTWLKGFVYNPILHADFSVMYKG